ncbi:lipoprotein signal peptidase [Serratia symbiotica str. 'Cinara cedri']|nr:lipoprotein signal peptidase [Serratia symbiotica str. 'Cinara cedri']
MSKLIYSTGLRWLWVVVVILVLDIASKQWVRYHLVLGQSKTFIPSFNLFYTRNYGAAFSFLAHHCGWQRWLFACIAIATILVLMVMMYNEIAQQKLKNIAYAFIMGGAFGNLYDRLYSGFVVDFIDFYVSNWHYPTFNLADIFICVGAVMIILESFL